MKTPSLPSIILSILFVCALVGCTNTPQQPALIQDLPREIAKIEPAFDRRLKALFPVGSDENALRAELIREGFQIKTDSNDPAGQHAFYEATNPVCRDDWLISWSAKTGKIVAIKGEFGATCL